MTTRDAVDILDRFNKWQRGEIKEPPSMKDTSEALDTVLGIMENLKEIK